MKLIAGFRKHIAARILVPLTVLLIAMTFAEVTIRYVGSYDEDGNFSIPVRLFSRPVRFRPYRVSSLATKKRIDRYLGNGSSVLMYDAGLGWKPRPGSSSANGLYHYDDAGIRASSKLDIRVFDKGTGYVAIFGDSFTHGSDVKLNESWGFVVEKRLAESGRAVEVLNFGVSGYGIDQAFLRWKMERDKIRPRVVILGFQPENVKRNLSLLWPLYRYAGGIPFAKPRFILEKGGLKLINVPAPHPREIPTILADLYNWDLLPFEHFFRRQDYRDSFFLRSKLIGALQAGIEAIEIPRTESRFYLLEDMPARLALRILDEFQESVESCGASFMVVHLPRKYDLFMLKYGRKLAYGDLLEEIGRRHVLIDPLASLMAEMRSTGLDALFSPKSHYSPSGNEIIASVFLKKVSGLDI